MGMALLRRHEMGDYLQRMYLTPDGHTGASPGEHPCDGAVHGPRELPEPSPRADAGKCQEGVERDHLGPQQAIPRGPV